MAIFSMVSGFLTICLLAAFIATGKSLSCESCWSFGHTCEGHLEDCPPDKDICGITQMRKDFRHDFTEKACFHSRDCNKPLLSIAYSIGRQFWTKTTCCMGKECEKAVPPLPLDNTNLNGKKCPACYWWNSHKCKDEVVECMGDNIYCVDCTATASSGNRTTPFVLKGCTNRNVLKDVRVGTSSEFFTIDQCVISPGLPNAIPGSGLPRGNPGSTLLFLQTFSGLLLLKILL